MILQPREVAEQWKDGIFFEDGVVFVEADAVAWALPPELSRMFVVIVPRGSGRVGLLPQKPRSPLKATLALMSMVIRLAPLWRAGIKPVLSRFDPSPSWNVIAGMGPGCSLEVTGHRFACGSSFAPVSTPGSPNLDAAPAKAVGRANANCPGKAERHQRGLQLHRSSPRLSLPWLRPAKGKGLNHATTNNDLVQGCPFCAGGRLVVDGPVVGDKRHSGEVWRHLKRNSVVVPGSVSIWCLHRATENQSLRPVRVWQQKRGCVELGVLREDGSQLEAIGCHVALQTV
eukprot:CAMPEP_0206528052 /NCGR_PEP_ID=MMETSP0325_2-20121206/1723_1 /ASSEMBLY_ACC=CAM_ASM_000347 /TAXON_ID=2866 /ORGANISM="Crypthecodinium cohnii, Strain Seligo" /LENGTH=285 /DNA_ID=CAMNT_0054023597 /DNA_START=22 /DNA_END=880 /DNA_ORIENTATION=-